MIRASFQADAEGHVREMEEALLSQRTKFLAQLAARDREIQVRSCWGPEIADVGVGGRGRGGERLVVIPSGGVESGSAWPVPALLCVPRSTCDGKMYMYTAGASPKEWMPMHSPACRVVPAAYPYRHARVGKLMEVKKFEKIKKVK